MGNGSEEYDQGQDLRKGDEQPAIKYKIHQKLEERRGPRIMGRYRIFSVTMKRLTGVSPYRLTSKI
jgi:hypothetical protein